MAAVGPHEVGAMTPADLMGALSFFEAMYMKGSDG